MSIRDLCVAEVKIHGVTGYQVQGLYRPCSDSFWEPVAHAAVFKDRPRAEKFLEKCKKKPSWEYDWAHWGKPADYVRSLADYIQRSVAVYSVL
jgi:hypothetical protein